MSHAKQHAKLNNKIGADKIYFIERNTLLWNYILFFNHIEGYIMYPLLFYYIFII